MLKRIKTARPAFAKQLVRCFVTRGFSQPILKQFRLRKFIAVLMLAMIGGSTQRPCSKPPRQTRRRASRMLPAPWEAPLRNDGPISQVH